MIITFIIADLKDIPKIKSLIEEIQPDYILHLAAQSSVAERLENSRCLFMNNTNIFLNIIDTVRLNDNGARVLSGGIVRAVWYCVREGFTPD